MNVRLGNEGELYHGPERTQMSVKAAEEARPRKQLSRSRQWGRVEVRELDGGLQIDVYVVVQYGVRITEVAHNLQTAVRFEVERSVGVPVIEVNVNVQGVYEP